MSQHKGPSATVHNKIKRKNESTLTPTEQRFTSLQEYIERTVAAAPPLTQDQLDRLSLLLRGAS